MVRDGAFAGLALSQAHEVTCIICGEDEMNVEMNAIKVLAIVLIVGGALALMYGGFSYTKDTQQAKIGPLELTVKDTRTVNVPVWAGVGAIVVGGILFFVRK